MISWLLFGVVVLTLVVTGLSLRALAPGDRRRWLVSALAVLFLGNEIFFQSHLVWASLQLDPQALVKRMPLLVCDMLALQASCTSLLIFLYHVIVSLVARRKDGCI